MNAPTQMLYMVIADESHKDIVLGAFGDIETARATMQSYMDSRSDAFVWMEAAPQAA